MKKLSDIGNSLVKHALTTSLPEIGQTTELVPYMLVAARTMSVREISAYLDKNYGVRISPSTVSRALNNKETHFKKIAEYLSVTGDHMARFYTPTKDYLFQFEEEYMPAEMSPLEMLYREIAEKGMGAKSANSPTVSYYERDGDAVCRMMELWDELPTEAQKEIKPMIFAEEDEYMNV
ncbi:hypothetical protein ACFPK9_02825 [Rubritalea spongiae]|uniref:XRE family transcriptional regulator n=1 Tax=Rubritalea spongiae TaxID=430797 RepID=A0ABW5E3T3_9BACT